MQEFNDYIRNIMFLVIFMTFVGIISPGGSYKKYIDIVLGLVLIIVVISPVAAFLGGGAGEADGAVARILDASHIAGIADYDEAFFISQRDRILGEHVNAIIRSQLDALLAGTRFSVYSSEASFVSETGALIDLRLAVMMDEAYDADAADTAQAYAGRPFIRVERVDVSLRESRLRQHATPPEGSADSESIQLLKQTISDFYNIDAGNIHIEVLMRRG
ncbi:MAG: stage III sporulation protein AF [Defluviitaleaceae bacterium]|nr:stage III sporulation protein AF [Defluviitaleaceae bacterium]